MSPSGRRLGGLVDTYLRKKLRRDIHPAITAVRDENEGAVTVLTTYPDCSQATSSDALVTGLQQSDVSAPCAQNNNDDDDDDDDDGEYNTSLEEIYRDAKRERQRFETAMEAYESTTAGSSFSTDVTGKDIHTWDDVLLEAQQASNEYYDDTGRWGKVRKGFRSFGQNSKAFDAWATLMPSGSEYLSLLCGGMKLIFGAAARLHDLRSDICDALVEIPFLLTCTNSILGIFKQSKDLHQASAGLYIGIIAVLHHIVAWYREKAMKTLFKVFFKQDTYAQNLDDLLKGVRQHANRFNRIAQLHSYEGIHNTFQMLQLQGMEQKQHHEVLIDRLDQSSSGFLDVKGQISEMRSQVADINKVLTRFLCSNSSIDPKTQDSPNLPIHRAKSEPRLIRDKPGVQNALISAFEFDGAVIELDIAVTLRSVWQLPRNDQDRLVEAMQSPKLQRWIVETTSSAFFLNFNAIRNQRSTSFLAAKLADSIQTSRFEDEYRRNRVLVLCFFCGSHSRPNDLDYGVAGTLRNLISQLLLAYPDFALNTVRHIKAADFDDVSDLCRVFSMLIAQIPQYSMVFCILDGVTCFEGNKTTREESQIMMSELMEIVTRTAEYGCCFKLLLTSPGNSRYLCRYLGSTNEHTLSLPSNVPSRGGFTRGMWDSKIGKEMDRLRV